jgi:hypothetical protein
MRSIAAVVAVLSAGPTIATEPPPDCSAPEHHQFDFWIGKFEVTTPDGKVAGHNVIESTLGGCALTEHWTGAKGSEGRSINFYDRQDKRWHQVWIDSSGAPLRLSGAFTDGTMLLEGTTADQDGGLRHERIRWTPLADGAVRQHWEASTDGGASWSTVFDGHYVRKN